MKNLMLSVLILVSFVSVSALGANHQQGKNAVKKAFAKSESDDQGIGFGLTLKHVDAGKFVPPGSIKALQIFPINTVTSGFTYDFS